MFCRNCGTSLEAEARVCPNCGTQVAQQPAAVEPAPAPAPAPQPAPAPAPVVIKETYIPEQNQPLSGWAYLGLKILFCVPIVGFIFLLIFTFNGSNINRRNFARSYWCGLLVFAVIAAIFCAIAIATGIVVEDLFQ